MISVEQVKSLVENFLKDTDYELQTLEIDKDQNILVEVDRLGIVDVDFCAGLNRYLVEQLGDEDYALEVGSVSLTDPFKTKIQYQKNLGHNVVVTDMEGHKHSGQLISVDEDTFMIESQQTQTFRYDEVKKVIYNINI
ncbi:MAG: ribosome assembly cofactor RimP [Paludibacteraceae bacterium]|nr:ribosome assembly cofactor RimP [Paludibacteraceae bacterium]